MSKPSKFFYASGSPFAWRVHLVLEEKGIPYEGVLLSFQAGDLKKPEYLAISPHAKVPALTDGATSLYESQPIVEYLEERHPERPLLPADPAARALVRIEEVEATLYFIEAFGTVAREVFFTPPEKRDATKVAAARAQTRARIAELEARAAARGGDWVLGPGHTRADTTWLPFVEIAERGGVPLHELPWLAAWRERMHARPSYEATYPPHWRTSPAPA